MINIDITSYTLLFSYSSSINFWLYGINEFVANNQMLTPHQHGFCKGKSCLMNLLESLDEWTGVVDCGSGVNVIFLDMKKAFDSVLHCQMMKKLSGYGICGNLLRWLSNLDNKE